MHEALQILEASKGKEKDFVWMFEEGRGHLRLHRGESIRSVQQSTRAPATRAAHATADTRRGHQTRVAAKKLIGRLAQIQWQISKLRAKGRD